MEQGTIIDGRFELIAPIGEGGMGSVWSARELESGCRVALKVMAPALAGDSRLVTMFRREALAAKAAWRSPQVIDVEEVLELPGQVPCLVMELLEGKDLRNLLVGEGRLSVARAAELTRQVCAGLAELHGQGIVHRDLKPENIFVSFDAARGAEKVTLIDLGIASFRESPDGEAAALFDDDDLSCTPHYAAPEQLDGSGESDHRADIYAVGVLLYELLTGRRPFKNKSLEELQADVIRGRLAPPSSLRPELPAELVAVVMRALARAPGDRFSAVDELAEALTPFLTEASPKLHVAAKRPSRPMIPIASAPTIQASPRRGPLLEAAAKAWRSSFEELLARAA